MSSGELEISYISKSSPFESLTGALLSVVTGFDEVYPTAVSSPQQITVWAPDEVSNTPHVESVECSITTCLAVSPDGTEIV